MMTHLFGVPMQDDRQLWVSLTQIPGIGKNLSISICQQVGFAPCVLWKNLTLKQKDHLKTWMAGTFQGTQGARRKPLGTQYWQEVKGRKAFLIGLGTTRGIRLRQGLPVRGQKTHSNARTARKNLRTLTSKG